MMNGRFYESFPGVSEGVVQPRAVAACHSHDRDRGAGALRKGGKGRPARPGRPKPIGCLSRLMPHSVFEMSDEVLPLVFVADPREGLHLAGHHGIGVHRYSGRGSRHPRRGRHLHRRGRRRTTAPSRPSPKDAIEAGPSRLVAFFGHGIAGRVLLNAAAPRRAHSKSGPPRLTRAQAQWPRVGQRGSGPQRYSPLAVSVQSNGCRRGCSRRPKRACARWRRLHHVILFACC